MTEYDPKIHHRRSIRLREYDYSQPGAYFATICVQNRICMLEPEPVKKMVADVWNKIPEKFQNAMLDEFVIMPNHIHGIIMINDVGADPCVCPKIQEPGGHTGPPPREMEPGGHTGPPPREMEPGGHTGPPLQDMIQWFKTMTTNYYIRCVKKNGWEPFKERFWQRNYYEHVI